MTVSRKWLLALVVMTALLPSPARADLVLSELIVDLQPGKATREDVEGRNDSPERSYVSVEPREIINPSLPTQTDRTDPDPEKLGLLVEPARLILAPGQRRLIRFALLPSDTSREHVYRVRVKPVLGALRSTDSGLKLVVGYDMLVLVRPAHPVARVTASRAGRKLTFTNSGNVSVEAIEGRQCAAGRSQCAELPGKRLYPGVSWTVDLISDSPAEYTLKWPGHNDHVVY